MTNEVVKRFSFAGFVKPAFGLSLIMAAVSGGCSADVSRFSLPSSVALNDDEANTTGALGAPTGPVRERSNLLGNEQSEQVQAGPQPSGTAYMPPRSEPNSDVERTQSPEQRTAYQPETYGRGGTSPSYSPAAAPAEQTRPAPEMDHSARSAETIEVQTGDTLYGLSRRHHVSLAELMAVNGLSSPNLKPGQKLSLPSPKATREAALRPQTTTASDASPSLRAPVTETSPAVAVPAPDDWTGTYMVKPGDSLYSVARANKLKVTDLQRYNGIQDVRRVKPGTLLKVPASVANAEATPPIVAEAPAAPAPSNTWNATSPVQQPTTILNSRPSAPVEERVAANETTSATDATPAPSGSGSVANTGKLRWPAQGKVIAGFGQRPDGTHNDGINVAVPMGTEIHAAESGVVAYAGNELKGYGNLILLRHDNGWVTAYAHGDELLVRRGDKVKRGQVIAKAGKTGQVDQPQVHFELRQGQQPVDPTPHLERL